MAWYKAGGGGLKSSDVNATLSQVLSGRTALTSDSNDEVGTGTMPNNGATGTTLGFGGSYSIPAGYTSGGTVNVSITDRRGWASSVGVGGTTYIPEGYHNGNGYVSGPWDGNLVAGNIRNGVNIFGVWGNVRPYGSWSGQAYAGNYSMTISPGFTVIIISAQQEGEGARCISTPWNGGTTVMCSDNSNNWSEYSVSHSTSFVCPTKVAYVNYNCYVTGYY